MKTELFVLLLTVVSVTSGIEKAVEKFTVRAKRQQCSCVVMPMAFQQIQCSCDRPALTNEPAPQAQYEQQQELQQQLQQLQSTKTSKCSCALIVVASVATSSPQYQCQCIDTSLPPVAIQTPGYYPLQSSPTTVEMTTSTATTMTTTSTSASTTTVAGTGEAVYTALEQSNPSSPSQVCYCHGSTGIHPCPCMCDCAAVVQVVVPEMCICPTGQGILTQANSQYQPLASPYPAQNMIQNDAVATAQYSQNSENNLESAASNGQLPATTPCLYYVVQTCVCAPQYVQCGENLCCLQTKFRSQKVSSVAVEKQPEPEKETSAVDMFFNVLHKIKTNLEKVVESSK